MKRIRISMICAFFLAQINLNAQFLGDSIKSDTTSYKIVQDSIDWNTRSNVVGDGIGMPIEIGEKSSDFSYRDTRNTTLFSNLYTGRSTNDVFYRFTLTVPMNVTMTHQGSGVSDTYMYLLDSNGTLIVSNDDYNGEGHCSNIYHSFIRRQLAAGTYYVVSEGYLSNGNITTNITGNTSAGYNYSTIPSTYSTSPGTFVGGMGGQFSVSPMGGATYSIPIDVPPGVGGLQPQLAIVYNSQSGNGLCGYGACLSGISSITRGHKDIYHDGAAKGVTYLAEDALYLDGVRLILSSGTAGQNNAVYNPESDPFTTVTSKVTNGNTLWFEVKSSDGMTYWYGSNQYSRLDYTGSGGAQKTHSWYLDRAFQPTGNYIDYIYRKNGNCIYPGLIMYGSNTAHNNSLSNIIAFTYNQSRSDSIPVIFDGQHGSMKYLLTGITCTTNDNVYRSYTLNYDSTSDATAYKFSHLTSVTEKNGQQQQLPATQLNWSYLPAVYYAATDINSHINGLSSPTVSINNQKFGSCDLNGDGIDDIIGYGKSSDENDKKIYVYKYFSSCNNNGVNFTVDHQYSFTPSYTTVSGDVSDELVQELKSATLGGSAVIDFDGDGRNEYLLGRIFKTYDMNANGTSTLNRYMEFFMLREEDSYNYSRTRLTTNCTPLYSTGDIDNDGRSDLIVLETQFYDGIFVKLHILSASVNPTEYTYDYMNIPVSNSVDYDLHLPYTPRQLFVADMNGNGLQDLLVIYANGYSVFWNRGGDITGSNLIFNGNVNDYFHYGQELTAYHMMVPGDYNGDGKMDILANGPGSSAWFFYFSNGDGSFTCQTACTLNVSDQTFTDRDDDKFSCNVVDLDSDGRTDIIVTKAHYAYHHDITGSWGTFHQTDTYWMRSTGTSLSQVYHATSSIEADALSKRYVTGDFNGDGRIELINYGYDCLSGNSNTDPVWRIYTNSSLTAQTGKVTSITGDFGITTNITYSTLTDSTVYTRGTSEPYPAPRYTLPLNVVKQTVQNNGAAGSLTTQYSYYGLKIHLRGRGLLGFCKTTADCITTGISTENGVTQWDTEFYIPIASYTKTTIGIDTAKTESILDIEDMGNRKYFAYPTFSMSRDMDGNLTYTYRSFNTDKGYIVSESTLYGTDMFRSVSYQNYTDSKVGGVYRPQRVVASQQHPDDDSSNPIFSQVTTYTYDSTTGAVTSMVENYGTSKPLTTSYTYDAFGNLTSQVSTGSGITNCTTYYTYDQTHRFPIRIYTNPASSVMKYTYDVFGNILTERDSINSSISNTITHTYNAWGQLLRTDMPDGASTTYARGWNNDAGKRYYILTQGTATPWVKTWYDNHGREVMTESIGPMNVSVTSSTSYNSKGLVSSHTENDGYLSLTQNYTYDSRGRVATESYTGGRALSYQYGNRSMTVTENNTRTTTTTYDAWGGVKTVTAPVSSISNTYASNGGIRQTDAGGATWTFQYDDRGNRTSMTDPDAGTTTYVYDAFGRETSRTDGRGIVFETKYDYLGRVTQRKAGSDAINYSYGTSGNGQLSLTSESNGTWTKNYTYDNLRRVITETMTNGTVTKTRTYQYGTNGLLSQRTVPGSKTYVYTYDAYGNLTGVDFGAGTVEWSLAGYTGKNTVSETVLDGYIDPFVKTTALDDNGLLDFLTTTQDGNYYQIDDLAFSAQTGNLTSRINYTSYYSQAYSYDNADRLTGVQQNNENIMSMTYSANGNISSKTGMGSYTYGSTDHPHAVTAVDNTSGIYSMNDQYVSYDSWGNVCNVWQTDNNDFYVHSIVYGPDQKRVTSETHKTYNTLFKKFYWDDYEEKTVGNDFLQYYYVYGGDGLAALHVVKTSSNNQTATFTYKVITDHLGSIVSLRGNYDWGFMADYDAWGNHEVLYPCSFDQYFDRGYTGHEHLLEEFGLINMNGRMYDPNLGRFLSPDNYIQSPGNPQNYNRYSYCLNNPLKYTDPSGELFGLDDLICAAVMGAILNVTLQGSANKINSFGDFVKSISIGALAGAGGVAAGGLVATYIPIGGFLGGAAAGAAGGFTSGFTTGAGNACINKSGKVLSSGWEYGWKGALAGGITGGIMGGIEAWQSGGRIWDGATIRKDIVDQSQFVTPSGQDGIKGCSEEAVEIVDRSFGGNITSEDVRGWFEGDPNTQALGDASTWTRYEKESGHKVYANLSKYGKANAVFEEMQGGARVSVNTYTGFINENGIPEGHAVVLQRATRKVITNIRGIEHFRYGFVAIDPGYSGGLIYKMPINQLRNAHNIFFIW